MKAAFELFLSETVMNNEFEAFKVRLKYEKIIGLTEIATADL